MSKPKAKQISNLVAVLLEQVKSHPKTTGYKLIKLVSPAWLASHQQIYRDLKLAQKNGYLVSECQANDGKPDSKHYTITEAGLEALQLRIDNAHYVAPAPRDEMRMMMLLGGVEYFESALTVTKEAIQELESQLELGVPVGGNHAMGSLERLGMLRQLTIYKADRDFAQVMLKELAMNEAVDFALKEGLAG